jgi:hypothetical protein
MVLSSNLCIGYKESLQKIHRIDYDETFSLVANMDSIRLSLTIAVAKGWEFH